MKKLIGMMRLALVGAVIASAATGCCLMGKNKCCCDKPRTEQKTSGVNTSMTISAGTDGMSVGSSSNIGSHGASGSMSTY